MTTSSYKRGDIFYVFFQFTDGSRALARPAIVASTDGYHASRREVVVGLTSNVTRGLLAGQFRIRDWEAAGLRNASTASGILMTIRSSLLERYVGTLSEFDTSALDQSLTEILTP